MQAEQFLDGDQTKQVKPQSAEAFLDSGQGGTDLRPFEPGEKVDNEDGTYSTERTVTVPIGDQWFNVPSLWMGPDGPVQLSEDQALDTAERYMKEKRVTFPAFRSVDEAVAAAKTRSKNGGASQGSIMSKRKEARPEPQKTPWGTVKDPIEHDRGYVSPAEKGYDTFAEATGKSLENVPERFQQSFGGLVQALGEDMGQERERHIQLTARKLGITPDEYKMLAWAGKEGLVPEDMPVPEALKTLKGRMKTELTDDQKQQVADMGLINPADIDESGKQMRREAQADMVPVNAEPGSPAYYGSAAIGSVAEMTPALLASAVTRNPSVGMAMIGGQVGGESYGRARDKGLSIDESQAYAFAQAAAEAIPESLPISVILKPGSNFLAKLGKTAVAESLQEAITGALQAGIDKGTIQPDMTWAEARQQIADSAIIGSIAGPGMATVMEPVVRASNKPKQEQGRTEPGSEKVADPMAQPDAAPEAEGVDPAAERPESGQVMSAAQFLDDGSDSVRGAPGEQSNTSRREGPPQDPAAQTPEPEAPASDAGVVVNEAGENAPQESLRSTGAPQTGQSAEAFLDETAPDLERDPVSNASREDVKANEQVQSSTPKAEELPRAFESVKPRSTNQRRLLAVDVATNPDPGSITPERVQVLDGLRRQLNGNQALAAKVADIAPAAGDKTVAPRSESSNGKSVQLIDRALRVPEINKAVEKASQAVRGGVNISEAVKSLRADLESMPGEMQARIEKAAQETDTNPTPARIEAGNYKKGSLRLHGLDIAIENPKGSTRSGTDPNGKQWESTMAHHYGYLKGTNGADGDQVDVFVGPVPESDKVFVVDQVDENGDFDEHKALIGFRTKAGARKGYKDNYEKGWKVGPMTEMSMDEFKDWVKSGKNKQPLHPESSTASASPEYSVSDKSNAKPLNQDSVAKEIQRLARGWKNAPDLVAVSDESGLPKALREHISRDGAEGRVRGVFWNNKVYLVAGNLDSNAQVQEIILHEVIGHYGIQQLAGPDIKPLLDQVWETQGNTDRAKQIIEDYFPNGTFDPANSRHRHWMAEELIAHMAQDGKYRSLLSRIAAVVQDALRKIGFTIDINVTDLQQLLRQAHAVVTDQGIGHQLPQPHPLYSMDKEGQRDTVSSVDPDAVGEWSSVKELRRKVLAASQSFVGKEVTIAESGDRVRIPRSGIKKTVSHKTQEGKEGDHALSTLALPDMLRGAHYISSESDKRGRAEIKAIHTYESSVSVGDRDYDVTLKVRETQEGKRFYDHMLAKRKGAGSLGDSSESGPAKTPSGPNRSRPDSRVRGIADENKSSGQRETDRSGKTVSPDGTGDRSTAARSEQGDRPADGQVEPPRYSLKRNSADPGADGDIPVLTEQPFGAPSDTIVRRAVTKIADKFSVLKGVQEEIRKAEGDIPVQQDAYMAEELFHGKVENDLRVVREKMIEPLAERMSQYDISLKQLDEYLYALHAPERNAVIAERNPELTDGGSGMTDAEAAAVMQKVEKSGKAEQYQDLANAVHAMLEQRRALLRRAGLADQETLGAWEATYKNYVPLKGFAADETPGGHARIGKGFSISGKESKLAGGRKSRAASPTSYAISDLTEAVIRRRKNQVGNTFLELVSAHPNPDYWQVFTEENPEVDRRPVRVKDPETGRTKIEVREQAVPMAMMGDRYFTTKRNGQTYYIKLQDERLMRAMRNLGPEDNNAVIRSLSAVTRVMSALNTSLNPEFVISNFARDIQTALLNLKSEQTSEVGKARGKKIAGRVLRQTPKAVRAIYASLRGQELSGDMAKWQSEFDRFRANGAKTGYFDMKDIDGQAKELEDLIKLASGGGVQSARRFFQQSGQWIEDINQSIENGVRLSAYVNAVEAGIPRAKAASLAKNMTVNFNRRGELGTTMNALYMFANASVQGTANVVRTLGHLNGQKGDPILGRMNAAQKIAVGMTVGGFTLALLNRLVAGDDDDGVNWWEKVPDYVKERNIVIMKSMVGGEPGEYWTIPLPYGYNVFPVIGNGMEDLVFGDKSAGRIAGDITLAALGSFSPIGFEDSEEVYGIVMKNITPTVLRPVSSIALNENFMGAPIYKENLPFGTPLPDSSLSFRSTPEAYKTLAKEMNDATGGSQYRPGAVDVSPDIMRYVVGYFGGGAYDFWTGRLPDAIYKAWEGIPLEEREVPFLRKISGKVLPYDDQNKFYRRRDEIMQLENERKNLGNRDRAAFYREFRAKLRLKSMAKSTADRLKELRGQRDRIEAMDLTPQQHDRRLRRVEKRMEEVIDRFNRRYETADRR